MNAKLYQTRVNSLNHYQKQIDDLNESLNVTKETRKSLLKELEELVELQKDDVFFYKGNVRKFVKVADVSEYTEGIRFRLECAVPEKYGWETDARRTTVESLSFEELESLKILNR